MMGTSQRRRRAVVGGGYGEPARVGTGVRAIGHDKVPSMSDVAAGSPRLWYGAMNAFDRPGVSCRR
jgi:hypothetical protein